jgi:hypothetical protein
MRKEINEEIIYLLKDEEFGEFSVNDLEDGAEFALEAFAKRAASGDSTAFL